MSIKTRHPSKATIPTAEKITVLLVAILVMIFCSWCMYLFVQNYYATGQFFGRTGETLFRAFLLDPIPESVEILHFQEDEIFRDYVLLHFKISPEDLGLILTSKGWETRDYAIIEQHDEARWWDINSLGDSLTNYTVSYRNESNNSRTEEMWVNSQKTEVFFEVNFIN